METRILIAGFGGQGVLSMGKLICQVADRKGLNVTFFPSYGGEQRGGTCNCTVILSPQPIGSPIATRGEYVIVMNEPSYERFRDSVEPGGALLVNTSQIHLEKEGAGIWGVEVDRLADQAGSRIAANMVMLGAFTRVSGFAEGEEVEQVLQESLKGKPQYLPINLRAFRLGLEQGHE